jgi:choice-of-anchor A domain-containing protein
MRRIETLISPVVLLSILLVPSAGRADTEHQWCIPGDPMVPNANPVVAHVCQQSGLEYCCEPKNKGGRWGLSCVTEGANWQHSQSSGDKDFCGRFAWKAGTVSGSLPPQAYPQDFNLVVLDGSAIGFRDSWGPIAASYDVDSETGFSVGSGSSAQPYAIVANHNVTLHSGTVYGNTLYGNNYTPDNTVNYQRPGTGYSKKKDAIWFGTMKNDLTHMSQMINLYPSIAAVRPTSSPVVTLEGTDPELNAFNMTTDLIKGATEFFFNVPAGSAVIINVREGVVNGKNAKFEYAGFRGNVPPYSKILWNFNDITVLGMWGMAFPGSILAPKATGSFYWGAINGTVVVANTNNVKSELHFYPYKGFDCSKGCLCKDPTWSCSFDTYFDDTGYVNFPAAEAGFLEIAGGSYRAENVDRISPKHRIWYSFQPADSSPDSKPLAVFFNGGPGFGTTAGLFAFNTATWTLEPSRAGPDGIAANQYSWTRFANLLYIDAPATGFSYPLPNDDSDPTPDVGIDIDHDAGIFLRVIVRFLARHPKIQRNPVILVGESYGGTRATLMLNYLFNYEKLDDNDAFYRDEALQSELKKYFLNVFSKENPSSNEIASKFAHQILIEPGILGQEQVSAAAAARPISECNTIAPPPCTSKCWEGCPFQNEYIFPTCDPFNCDKENLWTQGQTQTAMNNLLEIEKLKAALGVNPKTIEWMKARARTKAYGRDWESFFGVDTSQMTAEFGDLLGAQDRYFVTQSARVSDGYGCKKPEMSGDCTGIKSRQWNSDGSGASIGGSFLINILRGVTTFITVSKFDSAIWSPSIETAIKQLFPLADPPRQDALHNIYYDPTGGNFTSRPGTIRIEAGNPVIVKIVMMPTKYEAGHSIAQRAPEQLLSDVMTFYSMWGH